MLFSLLGFFRLQQDCEKFGRLDQVDRSHGQVRRSHKGSSEGSSGNCFWKYMMHHRSSFGQSSANIHRCTFNWAKKWPPQRIVTYQSSRNSIASQKALPRLPFFSPILRHWNNASFDSRICILTIFFHTNLNLRRWSKYEFGGCKLACWKTLAAKGLTCSSWTNRRIWTRTPDTTADTWLAIPRGNLFDTLSFRLQVIGIL